MHKHPYSQKNTFNIVITSNNNCVTLSQSNFRRYYVNTINESLSENIEYFNKLHAALQGEEVKILIFQRFMKIFEEEVKPVNWIGNNIGETEAKKIKKIEALPYFLRWIKERFLLTGDSIDHFTSEFWEEFHSVYKNGGAANDLSRKYLSKWGVEAKRYDGATSKRKYKLSFAEIKKIYDKNGWIDDKIDDIPEVEIEKPKIVEKACYQFKGKQPKATSDDLHDELDKLLE